jgi:hypothetical protein
MVNHGRAVSSQVLSIIRRFTTNRFNRIRLIVLLAKFPKLLPASCANCGKLRRNDGSLMWGQAAQLRKLLKSTAINYETREHTERLVEALQKEAADLQEGS